MSVSGPRANPTKGTVPSVRSLRITYTVSNGVWVQEIVEAAIMDSKFDRLEILRGPLRVGTTWTQVQVDQDGRQRTLDCTIEKIIDTPVRTLVVDYRERDGEYFERRSIAIGIGGVDVERLWQSPEGNFVVGYYLYEFTSR